MTHRYNDINPGDAIYLAARSYPGGIDALARNLREAMSNGQISTSEHDQLDRDIRTCIIVLLKLRKKIHIKHVTDQ